MAIDAAARNSVALVCGALAAVSVGVLFTAVYTEMMLHMCDEASDNRG